MPTEIWLLNSAFCLCFYDINKATESRSEIHTLRSGDEHPVAQSEILFLVS